jgi:multidrug efflux pump subunit AcrB
LFATIPGMSSAPPFGSNARTVVINVTPEKLKAYNLSADEVVDALVRNNSISPSGNLRVDSTMFITSINSLESTVRNLKNIPIKSNGTSNVFIRDVGSFQTERISQSIMRW